MVGGHFRYILLTLFFKLNVLNICIINLYFFIIAGRDKQRIYGLGSAASHFNFPEEYPSQTSQSS